ncbi:hypothetical protein K490DRAFT_54518 [Saccharata proteae CBS 121410]|uniref:DUF4139 domain-containing protein n=1 Tax=Saccharata proteae CBS 121410 TaxID=1314787 RepID=A0A9P4HZR6_9PEZI|nr:hypothetical protein K490DRAFT_54518 [Saccharata proteae CBS 121410]
MTVGICQMVLIKDLTTKSVTLYPTRAHVTRDITDIAIQPGLNEIEIYGLTPTTDENSIQLDGHGVVTVTDTTVELIANDEVFEDVYPDDSDDENSESDQEYQDSDDEPEDLKSIAAKLREFSAEKQRLAELQSTINTRVRVLDGFTNQLVPSHAGRDRDAIDLETVTESLDTYQTQRMEAHEAYAKAGEELKQLNKRILRAQNSQQKLSKSKQKKAAQAQKAKKKAKAGKQRQRSERADAKQRIRNERLEFWPQKVYRVTVTVEANMDTPASSRRSSVGSVAAAGQDSSPSSTTTKPKPQDKTVSLSLSYVVREAFWRPRYDITIRSVDKTATLVYRAEITNRTSETWEDALVTLSMSQTSFSGLDDTPPRLQPWNVRLALRMLQDQDDVLLSREEAAKPARRTVAKEVNRDELFGLPRRSLFGDPPRAVHSFPPQRPGNLFGSPPVSSAFGQMGQTGSAPPPAAQPGNASFGGFGSVATGGGALFGSAAPNPQQPNNFGHNATGGAGVTVDGAFLGTTAEAVKAVVPPGSGFDVPLGVDEGVLVRYGTVGDRRGEDDAAVATAAGNGGTDQGTGTGTGIGTGGGSLGVFGFGGPNVLVQRREIVVVNRRAQTGGTGLVQLCINIG